MNLTNAGVYGGVIGTFSGFSALCVNAYVFDPQEEEIGCCTCLVTPNGLNSLSVKSDLISNTLTPAIPTSVVIKLLAASTFILPGGMGTNTCNPALAGTDASRLRYGMIAWGSTLAPSATPGTYNAVNVPFVQATLSTGLTRAPDHSFANGGCLFGGFPTVPGDEITGMTSLCNFIQANGTGYGICKSCRLGALGGAKQ